MNEQEKQRLFDICRRSKLGQYVSPEDHAWLMTIWEKHQDEYGEIQERASKQAVAEYLGPFSR